MGSKLAKKESFELAELPEGEEEKRQLNARILAEVMQYAKASPVYTDAEVQERSAGYFSRCIAEGIKPTWEEYILALGVNAATVKRWERGEGGKVSPATITRAREIIASFDAKMVLEGKINPVTYFFRAKNYYGMRDTSEVVLTPNTDKEPDAETLINEANALPTGD